MQHNASRPDAASRPKVRCRQIEAADRAGVVRFLLASAPGRPAAYWERALDRMAARRLPEGVPRFGYLLDSKGQGESEGEGAIVGVLLTLYSVAPDGTGTRLRCNLSSWYVDEAYRGIGTLLDSVAMRDRSVTYTNLSPVPATVPMHEARGFRRYCSGQMLAVPLLSRPERGQSVRTLASGAEPGIPESLRDLVADHLGYGCLCLLCTQGQHAEVVILQRTALKVSRALPFLPRLPVFETIHAPPEATFARWLGAIGRHLLRHGQRPFVLMGVNARPKGVVGRHVDGWRARYARGPEPMPVNDLTYTEAVVLGP